MLPLRDDNPASRPAILTWLIIGACLAIYIWWQPSPLGDTEDDLAFNLENAAIPCELLEGRPLDAREVVATFGDGQTESCDIDRGATPPFVPDKAIWLAVVTSMFLHGSVVHIAFNMLFLWIFGNNVEDVFGRLGFVLFYVVGGIVATLTHVALNPESTVPLVGASGAIAAVMGAYAVLFPNARVRTLVFLLFIFIFDIRAIWLLGVWFALQFVTDPNSGVAWGAHVGGFVFGVVIGLAVRALRPDAPAIRSYRSYRRSYRRA